MPEDGGEPASEEAGPPPPPPAAEEEEPEAGPAPPPAAGAGEGGEGEEEAGPPPPPGAAAGEGAEEEEEAGPLPPPPAEAEPSKKRRRAVMTDEHRQWLEALPSAAMYERSYMHRDRVTHVAASRRDFFITASVDGVVKFWKKQEKGVEFVKQFRAHLGPVTDVTVSATGAHCATCSAADKTIKVFDVLGFDMFKMLRLGHSPGRLAFIGRGVDSQNLLAVADAGGPTVHVFDINSEGQDPTAALNAKGKAPVSAMRYYAAHDTLITCDGTGKISYWSAATFKFPYDAVKFKYLMDTDLFALAKGKTKAVSLDCSQDGNYFLIRAANQNLYLFAFRTGKLKRVYDETLEAVLEVQRSAEKDQQLDSLDLSYRVNVEKELLQAGEPQNAIFDYSGKFIIYPTLLGIKIINVRTNKVCRTLGKVENTERFLQVALFQGTVNPKRRKNIVAGSALKAAEPDPTLVCCSFKKQRIFLFSKREPEDVEDINLGRDVFNERPKAEDAMLAKATTAGAGSALALNATIHTTKGDIHFKLFADECPRTVENFTGHCKNAYYNGLVFHRVIDGFMLQTGCPFGDGTGGESIWGGDFEDEIRQELRHDRPYTLSMANSGPNTNGSQFFITTVACPWLDNKHSVFGRVTRGMDVVHAIEKTPCDKADRPLEEVSILSISVT